MGTKVGRDLDARLDEDLGQPAAVGKKTNILLLGYITGTRKHTFGSLMWTRVKERGKLGNEATGNKQTGT